MDFIQLPPCHEYTYVLVLVCVFSHGTGAFACKQAIACSVANILLEKIVSTCGTLLKLHGDQETHFTGQALRQVCAVWMVL